MIHSMTGYARVETTAGWGRLSWELRSVNHRYLDVQFKLPEDFRPLESELRQTAAVQFDGLLATGVTDVAQAAFDLAA